MYLQIGLCGALGAVSRYAISCWVGTHPFPLSTLIVNLEIGRASCRERV